MSEKRFEKTLGSYIITESWLDNETIFDEKFEDEEINVTWYDKISNIPYIDDDILSITNFTFPSTITTTTTPITSRNNFVKNNVIKHNNIHLNECSFIYQKFYNNNKRNLNNSVKENTNIDYMEIYLNSIYNNPKHPMNSVLKGIYQKCNNESCNNNNSEILYNKMINLFKNNENGIEIYIKSIFNNKNHPLYKSLKGEKILNTDKVDMEESTTTFTMSFNSSSIKMNDENDLGSPSFSKSLSAGSLISFAHLFISSVVNEDNDTPLGGEIAAEEDIDKDNWNNFQWNGQERPSLIELGTDDKTFWNSELWNSNDYNQNVICGINSEILEYCGAKGYDEDNEDYDVFRPENVDVQDDYIIAQEEEIIEALDNELKDCSYYEIN